MNAQHPSEEPLLHSSKTLRAFVREEAVLALQAQGAGPEVLFAALVRYASPRYRDLVMQQLRSAGCRFPDVLLAKIEVPPHGKLPMTLPVVALDSGANALLEQPCLCALLDETEPAAKDLEQAFEAVLHGRRTSGLSVVLELCAYPRGHVRKGELSISGRQLLCEMALHFVGTLEQSIGLAGHGSPKFNPTRGRPPAFPASLFVFQESPLGEVARTIGSVHARVSALATVAEFASLGIGPITVAELPAYLGEYASVAAARVTNAVVEELVTCGVAERFSPRAKECSLDFVSLTDHFKTRVGNYLERLDFIQGIIPNF